MGNSHSYKFKAQISYNHQHNETYRLPVQGSEIANSKHFNHLYYPLLYRLVRISQAPEVKLYRKSTHNYYDKSSA